MGGLVSGILGLVDGDPTKTEENELGSLSGYEAPLGEKNTSAASDFYGDILSGDPAKIAETLAPEIKAGQDQVQQQAMTNAQFGNRGGGTNASTQAAQSQNRANIINLIGQEQNTAAAGEAGLGTNLLSQASGNINSQAGLAEQAEQNKLNEAGNVAQGAAEIAAGLFDRAAMATPMSGQDLFNLGNSGGPVATEQDNLTDWIQ